MINLWVAKRNFQPKNLYPVQILSKNEFTLKLFSCQQTRAKGNIKGYSSGRRNMILDGNVETKDHEKNKHAHRSKRILTI